MARPSPSFTSLLAVLPLMAAMPWPAHAQAQSAFHPKGDNASQIAELAWVLFIGGGIIFLAVMLLLGLALFGKPGQQKMLGHKNLIIGGGIVFPVVVLTALLLYSLSSPATNRHSWGQAAMRVEVIGELWWWRVRYLDQDGKLLVETANEIRIPANQPVELLLTSTNVIHSFWVPNLAGKLDMVPGHTNRLQIRAHEPGVYRGQCAEYCGAQHAKMAFYVLAQDQDEFDRWLIQQRQPAVMPSDPVMVRGSRLFMENRCGQCHAIRGTEANGQLGPDLTHIGSRHSIAAGILPNNRGTLAGWIAGSQQIKPGNRMPSFHQFSGEELRALSAYLESLQ